MTSRYRRPPQPLPFQLTTRDICLLTSVYNHRFLTAAHLHQLHIHPATLRVAQVRLQRMWAAGLLDRTYLAPELPGVRDRYIGQPLYSLALRGAEYIAEAIGVSVKDIPHTKAQNRRGFAAMRHNLVFTDVAVAFEAFAKREPVWHVTVTQEDQLRRALGNGAKRQGAVVPDGAVTICHDTGYRVAQTILVEVVRAGVRAGNDSIRRKLHRYREALRTGFFRDVYGFEWVRNVIFLTTTKPRAANLAALAKDIPGADNLFRFGQYETRVSPNVAPVSLLSPDILSTPVLTTPSAMLVPFLPPLSHS